MLEELERDINRQQMMVADMIMTGKFLEVETEHYFNVEVERRIILQMGQQVWDAIEIQVTGDNVNIVIVDSDTWVGPEFKAAIVNIVDDVHEKVKAMIQAAGF